MRTPLFNNNEFLSQDQLNAAETLTRDSLLDITGNLHTAGLINASALSFSYSGLNITVSAPLPFHALFSDGTLASANGTTDGSTSSSATVDFSSLVPSTGSITAYLVVSSGSVAQEAYSVPGPPVGHPDYNPSFSPYTAYSEQQDTLIFSATTTAPDNTDTLLICSTVLSAGQTTITTSSTSGQVRAGAILSRNGEVLAATPQYAQNYFTPASGDTYTISRSFTAPCDGFIVGIATQNNGTDPQPADVEQTLSINGTNYGADNTLVSKSNYGVASVSAGTACTVTNTLVAGTSTGSFNALSQTISSIFIPNP